MKYLAKYFFFGTLWLSGCESGVRDAGIEGTGDQITVASSYGTVSGFGSIYVNGVHFDTDTAQVEVVGASTAEEALVVGMVVEVIGEIDADGKTGVAQTIRAERVLLGIIDAVDEVDLGRKAIRILGQTVYIDEDATLENVAFADLAPGLGASISGFVTDSGDIKATYLTRKDLDTTTDNVEVAGYVSSIDAAAQTFQLQDLLVQTSGSTFVNGAAEDIKSAVRVHVSGLWLADSQILQAERVTFLAKPAQEVRYTIIEGVIRNLSDGATFMVQNTLVEMQNAMIENGSIQDIQNAAQVIVFGALEQGVLKADRIHIKPRHPNRFRGTVSEINAAEDTFKLLDGLFKVTKFTQFKDNSRTMERYFNLERLNIDEEVEVFAVNVAGVWQVTRLTRRDRDMGMAGPPDRLHGKATMLDDDNRHFFINNLLVDASEIPEHEWNALSDNQSESMDVHVEGFYTGGGQFKAVHVHIHPDPPAPPIPLCDPHECGDGKPPVISPAERRQ
jgi:hypothetical protein